MSGRRAGGAEAASGETEMPATLGAFLKLRYVSRCAYMLIPPSKATLRQVILTTICLCRDHLDYTFYY